MPTTTEQPTQMETRRFYSELGEAEMKRMFASRHSARYDQARMRARIDAAIAEMKWRPAEGSGPFTPMFTLNSITEALRPPNVSAISLDGYLLMPDGPETGTYGIVAFEANYPNGRVRAYFMDGITPETVVPIVMDEGVLLPALEDPATKKTEASA